MIDIDEMRAKWEQRQRHLIEANAANRRAVFDALTELAIVQVDVVFDGCGDQGQIEDIAATGGSESLTGAVSFIHALWNGDNRTGTCSLAEAVEQLCYNMLEQEHDGWENNDGACGTFIFDVGQREIVLEFNERYTATETFTHSFREA